MLLSLLLSLQLQRLHRLPQPPHVLLVLRQQLPRLRQPLAGRRRWPQPPMALAAAVASQYLLLTRWG
jgi:hypothetical protein